MTDLYKHSPFLGFIFLLFCLSFSTATAQTVDKGVELLSEGNYSQALEIFDGIIAKEPQNAKALYFGGISHLLEHEDSKGLEYLEKAIAIKPDIDPKKRKYWLATGYNYNLQFDKAVKTYNEYLSELPSDSKEKEEVLKLIAEIEHAQKHLNQKTKIYVDLIKGNINTKYAEHSPVLGLNGVTMYYTSAHPATTGGGKSKFGGYYEDIMYAELVSPHVWGEPSHIAGEINSDHHDAVVQLFDNDSKMIVYRSKRGGDFYISEELGGGTWGKPYPFKEINSIDSESHAFITQDGLTVYFSSNRDNKEGHFDIFFAEKREDGKWDKPQPLGPEVNTEFDEDTPFVTEDGQTLYFSSTGHNSMGGFDVFRSRWDGSKWGKAQHLGSPINSTDDDMFYSYYPKDEIGYFASNRRGGMGKTDIYQSRKTYDILLEGLVSIAEKDAPVRNMSLKFIDQDHVGKYDGEIDEKGGYRTELESNTYYKVQFLKKVDDQEVLVHEDTVFIAPAVEEGKTRRKNFSIPFESLKKAPTTYTMQGQVEDDPSSQTFEGQVVVRNTATGEILGAVNIDEKGAYNMQVEGMYGDRVALGLRNSKKDEYKGIETATLGDSPTITTKIMVPLDAISSSEVGKEDYFTNNKDRSPDATGNPSPQNSNVPRGTAVSVVYFGFDEAQLSQATKTKLSQIIGQILATSKKVIVSGYTDSQGDPNYNIDLSQRRARSVRDYLISEGVDRSRIVTEGRGEDNPVGNNGTAAGRSQNRRVEVNVD